MPNIQNQFLNFEPLGSIKPPLMAPYIAGLIISAVGAVFFSQGSSSVAIFTFIFAVGFLIIGVLLFIEILRSNSKKAIAIEQFAQINNLEFNKTDQANDKQPGMVFQHGRSKQRENIISGTRHKLAFKAYAYKYVVGYGRQSRTVDLQVYEITLPRSMPHMVIDSLVEYGNEQGSTLPIDFDQSQKLELEGDFYKYFSLYAPDKYGISALSIIAPDVMETLMEYASMCDIEIIDNRVYFYWPDPANSKKQFENYFATVDGVIDKIEKKLLHSNIFANSAQQQVHSQPNNKGVHLKKTPWKGIISAVTIFIFLIIVFDTKHFAKDSFLGGVVMPIFIAGSLLFSMFASIYMGNKKNRLRKEIAIRNRANKST